MSKSIDEFLNYARVALDNAQQTPEILAALTVFGYDLTRLQEGVTMLQTAQALHAAQVREYGEQYEATTAVLQAREAAEAQYNIHCKLTRVALKDDVEKQKALGLHQSRKRSLSGWLHQAQTFYTNALNDAEVLAGLASFNVIQTDLEAAQVLVQQVADLDSVQEREKAEAQKATKVRDAALDALDDWLHDLRQVALIALADNPQMLEALQFAVVA